MEFLSNRDLLRYLVRLNVVCKSSNPNCIPLTEQQAILKELFSRHDKYGDFDYQSEYLKYNHLDLFKSTLLLDTQFPRILIKAMLSPASTFDHKFTIVQAWQAGDNKRLSSPKPSQFFYSPYSYLDFRELTEYKAIEESERYQYVQSFIQEQVNLFGFDARRNFMMDQIVGRHAKMFQQVAMSDLQKMVDFLANELHQKYTTREQGNINSNQPKIKFIIKIMAAILIQKKDLDIQKLKHPVLKILINNIHWSDITEAAIPLTIFLIPHLSEEEIQTSIVQPLIHLLMDYDALAMHQSMHYASLLYLLNNLLPVLNRAAAQAFANPILTKLQHQLFESRIDRLLSLVTLLAPKIKYQDLQKMFTQLLVLLEQDLKKLNQLSPVINILNQIHSYLEKSDIQIYQQFLLQKISNYNPEKRKGCAIFIATRNFLIKLTDTNDVQLFIEPLLNHVNDPEALTAVVIILSKLSNNQIQLVGQAVLDLILAPQRWGPCKVTQISRSFLAKYNDENINNFINPLFELFHLYKDSRALKIINECVIPKLTEEDQDLVKIKILHQLYRMNKTEPYLEVQDCFNLLSQWIISKKTSQAFQTELQNIVSEHQNMQKLKKLQDLWLSIQKNEKNNTRGNSFDGFSASPVTGLI